MGREPYCQLRVLTAMNDGECVIRFAGELDVTTVDQLTGAIDVAVERASRRVVIDVRELEFTDSQGINALIIGARAVRNAGGELSVHNPSSTLRRLFAHMGMEQLVVIHPDGDGRHDGDARGRT